MTSRQQSFSANWKKSVQVFFRRDFYLVIALAICAPIYLNNMIKHSVPMGYAGLFTQMAKQIADANFAMPSESPYYGPGGIPFVYPPLGLYFFAFIIKLTGKYFIFLRFLPPLMGLASLVPLYYVMLELSQPRLAAMSAVIIAGGSLELYTINAYSAGIVRAPAFIFSLLTICYFLKLLNTRSRSFLWLAGLFFGFTLLSHLVYALFCFLWFWWWSAFDRHFPSRIKETIIVTATGLLVASLWLIPVLLTHGVDVLVLAFGSHGGNSLFTFWLDPSSLWHLFANHIVPISSKPHLAVLVLLGIGFLLTQKNFALTLFYPLIILGFPSSESARFVFLTGSLIAGIGLAAFAEKVSSLFVMRWKPILVTGIVLLVLGLLSWNSFVVISRQPPRFYDVTLDLAKYIQVNMPTGQKYLALLQQDEAEWLPFLFQREPVVGKWGGEWIGTYVQQMHYVSLFRGCQLEQDWACVKDTFAVTSAEPAYIISYFKDRRLNEQIQQDDPWQKVFENGRYVVWSRQECVDCSTGK